MKKQSLVFAGTDMKERLEQVLALLRDGYIQKAYELIEELLTTKERNHD